MRPIGYYVHHHGDGHRQRALAVSKFNPDYFTLFGTGLAGRTGSLTAIDLPDDRLSTASTFDGADGEQHRPHALHYAPLRHDGVRSRMTTIAQWIANAKPGLIVADTSVEIAMLARLCATPVAYVRLGGYRDDVQHLEAFRSASVLIAPFAEALDEPDLPAWIRRKTFYAPGIVKCRVDASPNPGTVLVVCGRGGSNISHAGLISAARSMPHCRWRVIGMANNAMDVPANLVFAGWTDEPELEIARADVIVGGAGDGLVAAVLAARRPFICIPEQRPFDEQVQKAIALQRLGAAVISEKWPDDANWDNLFKAAHGIDAASQASLDDPDGASRLATMLIELASHQK